MKRVILTAFLAIIGLITLGQNTDSHGKLITAKKVTIDTNIVLQIPTNQAWGIVLRWTSATFDSSTAIIKSTKDYGVSYQTYYGIPAQELSGSSGSLSFEDMAGCACTAIEVYIDIKGSEVGYMTIEYVLTRKY